MRKRLRPNSKTLQGEKALQERWYADVPTLPSEKASMYQQSTACSLRYNSKAFRRFNCCRVTHAL